MPIGSMTIDNTSRPTPTALSPASTQSPLLIPLASPCADSAIPIPVTAVVVSLSCATSEFPSMAPPPPLRSPQPYDDSPCPVLAFPYLAVTIDSARRIRAV